MQLPSDPIMLLSVINTRLRDEFDSFDELCKVLDLNSLDLIAKLQTAGFEYLPQINQFR